MAAFPAAPAPGPVSPAAPRAARRPLKHVIYVSQARAERPPGELADILHAARRHNTENEVTGVLVYFNGRYLQYFEGPPRAVDDTLRRIRQDSRHHDVEVMTDGPAARRLFARWSMGCIDLDSESWQRLVDADWPYLAAAGAPGLSILEELSLAHHDDPPGSAALAPVRLPGPESGAEPEPGAVEPAAPTTRATRAARTLVRVLQAQVVLMGVLLLLDAYLALDLSPG